MEFIAYLSSALIGISLGLIGGGGSIMTIPVLVYLFGISPLLATSYSLFIVGSTSLIGAVNHYRKGQLSLKAAVYFGTASIITVFVTRKYMVPFIPENLLTINGFSISSNLLIMVLFGLLMLIASISMIRNTGEDIQALPGKTNISFYKLFSYGIAIGLVTGFLGAGGGFLLIPALINLLRLPMKTAIGTSLLIIALNSLIGFAGDLGHFNIEWDLLLKVSSIAILGLFIGSHFSKKIGGEKLKKAFGWFILIMGLVTLVTN